MWGGGWLAQMGALDFAGGTVVHVNCGMAALALSFTYWNTKKLTVITTSPRIFHNRYWTSMVWMVWI